MFFLLVYFLTKVSISSIIRIVEREALKVGIIVMMKLKKVLFKVVEYFCIFMGLFIGGSVGTYQGLNAYTHSQISHAEVKIGKQNKINNKVIKKIRVSIKMK